MHSRNNFLFLIKYCFFHLQSFSREKLSRLMITLWKVHKKSRDIYVSASHSSTRKIILSDSSHVPIDLIIRCYKFLRQEQVPAAGVNLFLRNQDKSHKNLMLEHLVTYNVCLSSICKIEPSVCWNGAGGVVPMRIREVRHRLPGVGRRSVHPKCVRGSIAIGGEDMAVAIGAEGVAHSKRVR